MRKFGQVFKNLTLKIHFIYLDLKQYELIYIFLMEEIHIFQYSLRRLQEYRYKEQHHLINRKMQSNVPYLQCKHEQSSIFINKIYLV